jgi:ribosome modulation factor
MSDHRRRKAYVAGEQAARDGKGREACTRQRGTIFYDDWMDGWESAATLAQKDTQNG